MREADVLVIGGTADSKKIVNLLCQKGIRVLVSVATKYGAELLPYAYNIQIHEGKLESEQMERLIRQTGIKCVIDASHPYAEIVSLNAISACKKAMVPYIRYERQQTVVQYEKIIEVNTAIEAAMELQRIKGNILLTTGSKNIEIFVSSIPDFKKRLFARVLPQSEVILKCEKAGLSAENLIAIKGPFSTQMNTEMIKYCNASVIVTKDSGEEGGFKEKIRAAEQMNIQVILIKRPSIKYPDITYSVNEAVEFAQTFLFSINNYNNL